MRLIPIILLACCIRYAGAADYYVDATGGNNANAGTSSGAAWQTLSKLTNGVTFPIPSTVFLKRGETWHETLTMPTNFITVDAYGAGAAPVIDGDTVRRRVIDLGNFTNTTVKNVTAQNGGGGTGSIWLNSGAGTNWLLNSTLATHATDAGISGNGDSHSIISNCFIHGAFDDGFTLHTTASGEVYSCVFSNNAQGINHSGSDMWMAVADCVFTNNTTSDVGPLSACVSTFRRCKFSNTNKLTDGNDALVRYIYCLFDGRGGGTVSAPEFNSGPGDVHILNCTFYGAGNIKMDGNASAHDYLTNTILASLWRLNWSSGVIVLDHCLTNNLTLPTLPALISGQTADPQFVSAGTGNFSLQSSSPARDAGVDIGLTLDHAGNPIVNPPDIGAFEYTPPPPPASSITFSGRLTISGMSTFQ